MEAGSNDVRALRHAKSTRGPVLHALRGRAVRPYADRRSRRGGQRGNGARVAGTSRKCRSCRTGDHAGAGGEPAVGRVRCQARAPRPIAAPAGLCGAAVLSRPRDRHARRLCDRGGHRSLRLAHAGERSRRDVGDGERGLACRHVECRSERRKACGRRSVRERRRRRGSAAHSAAAADRCRDGAAAGRDGGERREGKRCRRRGSIACAGVERRRIAGGIGRQRRCCSSRDPAVACAPGAASRTPDAGGQKRACCPAARRFFNTGAHAARKRARYAGERERAGRCARPRSLEPHGQRTRALHARGFHFAGHLRPARALPVLRRVLGKGRCLPLESAGRSGSVSGAGARLSRLASSVGASLHPIPRAAYARATPVASTLQSSVP